MNDTYTGNVDDIDQPVELEGVRLNWGPLEFVQTHSGPRARRTASATAEFWGVWKRNEEALKTVGISCARQSSGDWRVEWWNDICIYENKSYALSEVIEAVKHTLDAVSAHSAENKLRYSATDLYWLLHDMLRYINQNVPGEYVLHPLRKDTYQVRHNAEDTAKRSSSRKLKAEVNRTANYLEELTGRRPSWGEKE
ncbi:hypothetical protein F4009_02560 [Candidatus Poribacteria bacterium]|nr:hypothetical protein [Candidatus Poribacteria bacterium]MYH83614.1 hypothetical protein [Candidatus Poribacteria bacterium]MYK92882.1 hypothetical protein [Candidatus Poribacteria bacterium]